MPTVILAVIVALLVVALVFVLVVLALADVDRRNSRRAATPAVDHDALLIVRWEDAAALLPAELVDAIEHPQLDTGDIDPVSGFRVIRHRLTRRRGTAAVIATTGEQFAATIRLMQGRQ